MRPAVSSLAFGGVGCCEWLERSTPRVDLRKSTDGTWRQNDRVVVTPGETARIVNLGDNAGCTTTDGDSLEARVGNERNPLAVWRNDRLIRAVRSVQRSRLALGAMTDVEP